MQGKCLKVVCGLMLSLPLQAAPVISEFMADNETTLADNDGEFSDWIEIHNPDSTPVSLLNWSLTDNASNLTKWRFPAVTLQPGEFRVIWASSKNRRVTTAPLHTNFSLSKDGEFLALVRPDGVTIAHSFSPSFPAQDGDESYGLRFDSTVLLSPGATGRYRVPTSSDNPPSTWTQPGFADAGWTAGASGFGFGIQIPGITVRQVSKNGSIEGLNDAVALASLPTNHHLVLSSATAVMPVLNLLGDGSDGHYGSNLIPPGNGGENYVIIATGNITIPATGTYTFGLNSDDGGRIVIDGTEVMRDDSFHGPQDSFGTITLTAGQHSFEVIMFEGGVGDCVEFFAAAGSHSSFNASLFRLVGDVANGGLVATTTPSGGNGLIATNLQTAMSGNPGVFIRMPLAGNAPPDATSMSLVMRYNDGFASWLNGTPLASSNAPSTPLWNSSATATRTTFQSLEKTGFNATALLSQVSSGNPVLAIHGMNQSAADFLVLPELIAGKLHASSAPVPYGGGLATPGWINGAPSSLGNVASVQFSTGRGFYTSPVSVALSSATPGAVIRYTTDGSTPTDTHGTIYTVPLGVSQTTVLRAVATLSGWKATRTETHSYLFPDDILTQSPDGSPPPGWPASSGTSQVLDHGMDPEIVNHTNPELGGPATVKAALLSIPSVSLTTDLPNLFNIGGSQGIYSNPHNRGFAWERPVSMEWINPPNADNLHGTGEFQINAGMRMRGGFSRSTDNPKHAMRFFFREEYGETKLRYPLFGRDAAQEFDKIDLRTSQNYAWSFLGDGRNTFLREESARQAQLDMGHPGSHVSYVHVYLNGRYWGLFDLDERPEAAFAESYLGGDKDDYDVVKSENDADYTTGATDGNLTAWLDLRTKAKTHRASPTNANYFRLMGLAADGTTPTAEPVLLDADNLIDYMLLTFWTGNLDGCVSGFLGNDKANNWFGSRRRENNPRQGFKFFVHDFEHSMLDVNEDRTGPFPSNNENNAAYYNPLFLHQDLMENEEYKMRWADRVHRHLFNGGALTPAAWQNRVNKLATFVDASIVAESARWGDTFRSQPYTKADWINAQNGLVGYFTPRNPVVLSQLRADHLYPQLDAPVVSPFGGHQPVGTEIAIQGPPGATLYYMPDGSDPRAVGGALKSGALVYTASTTTQPLIPWSAGGWSYLADGSNQGVAWRSETFNSSSWPVGTAELGFGDGDEASVIPIIDANPSVSGIQRVATTYFRRTFNVTDAHQITSLGLTVEYDDTYVVYLNGTRVAGNLPLNPPYDYYSGNPIEDTIDTLVIPTGLLHDGTNTIAVEIHQCNDGSSDLSMNLSLLGTRSTTATPMVLENTGAHILRVRAKNGADWSAMAEATYQVGTEVPSPANLVVSEISYFPPPPDGDSEFIELLNAGSSALDLSGCRFTDGIDFTFPVNFTLAAGARVLVVKNVAAFQSVHGTGRPVAGEFQNDTSLSNTGEHIRLETADGTILLDFTYGVDFPWPASAAGLGRSMVLMNPSSPANPGSWRPSATAGGNPGTSDAITRTPGQSLLTYALAGNPTAPDTAGQFSVARRLGADAATISAEWSSDLGTWHTGSLQLISETNPSGGNSVLTWKLDPKPTGKAFIRLRVTENP